MPARAAQSSRAAATSRSPIFGPARHQATGIPSGVLIRYGFSPPYQRECAAQYPWCAHPASSDRRTVSRDVPHGTGVASVSRTGS
jgi:hypothetical protein